MTLRVSEKRLKVNVISSQSEGIIILINFFYLGNQMKPCF